MPTTEAAPKRVPPPRPVPVSLLAPSRFDDELFWRGFKTSASIHAVVAILAVITSLAIPHSKIKFMPSIRVDLVALPDLKKADIGKTQPEDYSDLSERLKEASQAAKKLTETTKKKEAPPPDNTMALKKDKTKETDRKKEKSNAIERMKALAAIEEEDSKNKPKTKVSAKGNKLSAGNSLTGGPTIDTNTFVSHMQTRLRDNWNLPVWLAKQSLDAKIVIFLDRAGYVNNTVVAKSSGNRQFDDFCLKTIRMAQPFGTPPDDILNEGLTLGFPL